MSYLIALILLLLPTYLLRFSIFGIPTTLLEILIYIVFIFGLCRAIKSGFRPIPRKIWLPVGLLIIALIISTVISPDKRTALGEFKGFFIDPILVGWLIYQFIKKEDLPRLFGALMGAGLFVASHTIVQKLLGHTTPDGRVIGIFGYSPNYTALFLAPVATLLIAYGLSLMANKKYLLSVICYLLSVISVIAIYFSGSRGGFLAIIAGLGIYLVANYWPWIKNRISAKIIILILIIAGLYTVWTVFRPDFSASPEAGRVASSNNVRFQIWQASIELGSKHPILGVGLGNFQNAFGELTKTRANFPEYIIPYALTPHNLFLMFWLSTGILGLISFLAILVVFYLEAVKKLLQPYSAVILAVFSAIIIYGLIEASFWKNDLSLIFWTFWALIWII